MGGAVLRKAFHIFGEQEAQRVPVRAADRHVQLLLETAHDGSQRRALLRAGPRELDTREAAAVHEACAAGGAQSVIKAQGLHGTEIHKAVVADLPERLGQRQLRDIPVVPFLVLRPAESPHFLALYRHSAEGEGAVMQRRDREAENLLRQHGALVAGDGAQDRNAALLPPHGETPVCKSADRFQV